MKALSIIGIVFSLIFTLWFLLFVESNGGRISVEEFAPVGIFFGLWSIAFAIVATTSSFKKKAGNRNDILDNH